jgi:flagellar biosynthesis chaperone FliJ
LRLQVEDLTRQLAEVIEERDSARAELAQLRQNRAARVPNALKDCEESS